MAAIAYPFPLLGRSFGPRVGASEDRWEPARLRLVEDLDAVLYEHGQEKHQGARVPGRGTKLVAQVRVRHATLRRRRLVTAIASIGLIWGLWSISGIVTGSRVPVSAALPGAVQVKGGQLYTAHRGDTLWSIASRVEPSADPRPLVARLSAQLGGATLQPGNRLLLP